MSSLAGDSDEEGSGEAMVDILAEMSGEGPSGSGSGSGMEMGSGSGENESEEEEDAYALEYVEVAEDFYYMAHVMRLMAALHSIVSLAMLVAYYHLKVPRALPLESRYPTVFTSCNVFSMDYSTSPTVLLPTMFRYRHRARLCFEICVIPL